MDHRTLFARMSVLPLVYLALTGAGTTQMSPIAGNRPDPALLAEAKAAVACAQASGHGAQAETLTLIDYRRPSTDRRLWVIELATDKVRYFEHVAHGRNSGENFATRFSNVNGSNQSSLGLYVTQETYQGGNGYSLRLNGLEPGINDKARERAIVMHGAPYVNPDAAKSMGRLGRSLGCPALRGAVAGPVINTIKDGNFLYAYYPQPEWLRTSTIRQCAQGALKGRVTAALRQ